MKVLRGKVTRRTIMGGGSMDIIPSLQSLQKGGSPALLSAAPSLRSDSPRLGGGTPGTRPPSLAVEFFSSLFSLPSSPASPSPRSPLWPPPLMTSRTPRSASVGLHRLSVSDIKSLHTRSGV